MLDLREDAGEGPTEEDTLRVTAGEVLMQQRVLMVPLATVPRARATPLGRAAVRPPASRLLHQLLLPVDGEWLAAGDPRDAGKDLSYMYRSGVTAAIAAKDLPGALSCCRGCSGCGGVLSVYELLSSRKGSCSTGSAWTGREWHAKGAEGSPQPLTRPLLLLARDAHCDAAGGPALPLLRLFLVLFLATLTTLGLPAPLLDFFTAPRTASSALPSTFSHSHEGMSPSASSGRWTRVKFCVQG